MARFVHRDRSETDPIPLRRVVRQRPLTDQEVASIYGRDYGAGHDYGREPAQRFAATSWEPAYAAQPHAYQERVYSDEAVDLPMRRPRWGWLIVALILLPALALLGYALAARSDTSVMLARAVGVDANETIYISAEPLSDVPPLDVTPWQSMQLEASAVPNRGPGLEAADGADSATAPSNAPVAAPRTRRAAPAAPIVTPVPDTAPAESAPTETPYPNIDAPPADLDGTQKEAAPPETAPGTAPETAPGTAPEAPPPADEGILRDPGF